MLSPNHLDRPVLTFSEKYDPMKCPSKPPPDIKPYLPEVDIFSIFGPDYGTQQPSFENNLSVTETRYLSIGLKYYAIPTKLRHSKRIEDFVHEAFTAESHMLAQLESYYEYSVDAENTQFREECEMSLKLFEEQLEKIDAVVDNAFFFAYIIASNKQAESRREQALWDWIQKMPMVKDWIKDGTMASSKEDAFEYAIRRGDMKTREMLSWMTRREQEDEVMQDDGEEVDELPKDMEGMEGVPTYDYQVNNLVMR